MFLMPDVVCFSQRDPVGLAVVLLVAVLALLGVSRMVTLFRE